MNIGLYHGYNLTGSGSNEYTRYLAKTFLQQGHTVHVICREYQPEKLDFIGQLCCWKTDGSCDVTVIDRALENTSVVHQIPYGDYYPVYITGKKSSTVFKEFVDLTDSELESFKTLNQLLLRNIFSRIKIDVLHANHLVMQPSMAIEPCKENNIPLIIYPHGSAIEYAVKRDSRYLAEARQAIVACDGLVIGNNEVKNRISGLYPDLKEMIEAKTQIVGVGVDTQLFTPKTRSQRNDSVNSFIDTQIPSTTDGKSPDHMKVLHTALKDRDFPAIAINSDSYVQNNLDTDIREKLLALDFSKPVILFVGALTVGKGLQSLITALPDIYKAFPDVQLVVIGAGDFRERLEALIYALVNKDMDIVQYLSNRQEGAEERGVDELWQDVVFYLDQMKDSDEYFLNARKLRKQVVFLGRFNHKQLSYIFPCADLTVFPSVIPEAYPLVLMESLANGVLPVVSYFSGFKDGVDELEQYLDKSLVSRLRIPMDKERRVKQLSLNIVELLKILQNKDFSDELSAIARSQYDWTRRASQMVEAYKKVT
ncbi:glycosyltransferase family 4 protein [Kaarinaea lacus]